MSKIIITGGLGFIGINLVLKLLQNVRNEIVIIDDGSSSNKEFVFSSHDRDRITILEESINSIDIQDKHFKNVDTIFHLACIASPKQYIKNPQHVLDTCYIGTKNILEIAKNNQTSVFYASSSEVYGDSQESPQKEDYYGNVNTFCSRSCYMEGKRISETLCFEYIDKYNVDIKIGRLFNTYGPYMSRDDGRVVSNFLNQCVEGKNLTIYGDGLQTRSFTYIDDCIQAILLLMKTDYNTPVNIGSPNEIQIIEFANIVKQNFGFSGQEIDCKDGIKYEVRKRFPDITRITSLIDWAPQTSLITGLKKTYDYFK